MNKSLASIGINFDIIFERHNLIMMVFDFKSLEIIEINAAGREYYKIAGEGKLATVDQIYNIEKSRLLGLIDDALENYPNVYKIKQVSDDGIKRYVDIHLQTTENSKLAYAIEEDVTARVINKKDVLSRDEILHMVSNSATTAITEQDLSIAIQKILSEIGKTFEVSRVFIMKLIKNGGRFEQQYEWFDSKRCGFALDKIMQSKSMPVEFERIAKLLSSGNTFSSNQNVLSKQIQQDEKIPNLIKSFVQVPIHINDAWWGFIGLDDCQSERDWENDELEAMIAISSIISSMLYKERQRKDLETTKMNYDLAVKSGSIGLWQWDKEAELIIFDKILKEQYGLEELSGKLSTMEWMQFIHQEDRDRIINYFGELFKVGDENFKFDHRMEVALRENLWFLVRGKIFYDDNGIPFKIIGTSTNISELKQAEQQINDLNKSLENKVKDRTSRLEFVLKELQGEIEIRKTISDELLVAKEDLLVALDTEKELSELKSRFISMVSHEYRTPLTVILSSVSIIDYYYDKLDKEDIDLHLSKIKSSVQKMTNLLEDIIIISKDTAGKIEVVKKEINVVELCRSALDEIAYIDHKQHSFDFIHHASDFVWQTDEKLLTHVLTNLLSNATKYSAINTRIKIEFVPGIDEIIFKITDSGIGIPKEEEDKIFEPFFRCKNAENIPGTGLGLSISQKFSHLLGGDITFESEYKKGSTFTLKLKAN
jgi:signal transduction histidine kinase